MSPKHHSTAYMKAEYGSELLRVVVVGFKLNAAGRPVALVTAYMAGDDLKPGEGEELEVRELGILDGLSMRSLPCADGTFDLTLFTLEIPDEKEDT